MTNGGRPPGPTAADGVLECDVAIAGGGPAGAFAALLLARVGLDVIVAEPGRARPRIEGLSERVLDTLAAAGVSPRGLHGTAGRAGRWPGLADVAGREVLVERRAFDEGLRAAARDAGVRFTARTVGAPRDGAWFGAQGLLRARMLVDARGRRAPAAAGRRRGPLAISVGGLHRADGAAPWTPPLAASTDVDGTAPEGPGTPQAWTRIDATPMGWVWRAGWGRRWRWTQITADPEAVATAGGAQGVWRAFFGQPLAGGDEPLPRRLQARAAGLAMNPVDLGAGDPLRIGDASVAIDPLSGHGLFWALASARMAVPIVRAVLDGQAGLAQAFLHHRVDGTFMRQARIGRDFHAAAAARFDTPYWRARAAWPDSAPAQREVVAPFFEHRVIVHDGRLRRAEVVCTAREPEGVAFVGGIEIVPLVRRIREATGGGLARALQEALPASDPASRAFLAGWLESRRLAGPAARAAARAAGPGSGRDDGKG